MPMNIVLSCAFFDRLGSVSFGIKLERVRDVFYPSVP